MKKHINKIEYKYKLIPKTKLIQFYTDKKTIYRFEKISR